MKAAPEGVAMAVEKNRLHGLCEKYAIDSYIEKRLNHQVEYLVIFKKDILPNTKTETQREKALREIETYAGKLKDAIKALSFEDRMSLDDEFFDVNTPGFFKLFDTLEEAQAFDLAGSLLPRLERAAITIKERIDNVGKSGAPKITHRQADFIRCIAQVLKPANIEPSHSGKFLEICEAIFEAAGLTFPDRALRYFMKDIRPKLKAEGYYL